MKPPARTSLAGLVFSMPRTSEPYAFAPMRKKDIAAMMEVERACFSHPWSPSLFLQELACSWSRVTIVRPTERAEPPRLAPGQAAPEFAGFCVHWLVADEIHILNIAIHPAYRRRGIAALLLEKALADQVQNAATCATLEVRRSNRAAIELYEKYGFKTIGVRPNYYADEREDALVMLKGLP